MQRLLLAASSIALASLPGESAATDARAHHDAASPGAALAPASAPTDPAVGAAQGAGFAVPRHVIGSGGGSSSGGVFAVKGTIGQADADPLQPSTGGVFAITGGFWPGAIPPGPVGDAVFANGFEPGVP
jgi:hypothetical protein